MRRLTALIAAAAAIVPTGAIAAPSTPWIEKEFSVPGAVPLDQVEAFLNTECRPSGFDGIQTLAVQRGHEDAMHLHVYCRQDGSAKARYRVTMPGAPERQGAGPRQAG